MLLQLDVTEIIDEMEAFRECVFGLVAFTTPCFGVATANMLLASASNCLFAYELLFYQTLNINNKLLLLHLYKQHNYIE